MRATSKPSKSLFKVFSNPSKRQRENSRVALPPSQAKGTTTGKGGRPIGT